jgi:hypothetical protein
MGNEEIKKIKEEYMKVKMSKEQVEAMKEKIEQAKKDKRKERRRNIVKYTAGAVTAAMAAFVILPNTSQRVAFAMEQIPIVGDVVHTVTFRQYLYEDDRNYADVETEKIKTNGKNKKLEKSSEKINEEIDAITKKQVAEFKEELKEKKGYQSMTIKTEVVTSNEEYFTLKLMCYQAAGSGSEKDYYYTIDLKTGECLRLKDLFKADADYKKVISDNIKEQMRTEMKKDKNVKYWLDDAEAAMWEFDSIKDTTSFYINNKGKLVICFNQGKVAPMYMGSVEFDIPSTVTEPLLK